MELQADRVTGFLRSLEGDRNDNYFLCQLEEEAREGRIPIIRQEMHSLLKLLLAMKQPKTILEVGAAIGYSALVMEYHNPVSCRITTIENYDKRISLAKENFRRAGKEDTIQLLEGDAAEVLKKLREPFDLIFMDAAKGQYMTFYPEVMRLLKPEGVLVSDNVLQEGDILESRFAVSRRNRTIHKRMREYLYTLTHEERLTTVILPIGDGVTVSVRKK